ncbi:hypothetical protein [Aliivibrio kagoshimensis]|uniref:hypothetical protein n=1 Tax=Aliivibrio kagoshimensis TaxID=2910230 RepID=UPI003D14638F
MNATLSLEEVQQALFSFSAKQSSERLPMNVSLKIDDGDDEVKKDLQRLIEEGKILWNYNMKSQIGFNPASNPDHLIRCVAYYGNKEMEYYCVGYVLGCVNKDGDAMEIDFIEKRSDASEDLRSKFLPIIVDAFATYGLYLNSRELANINKLVLVGPVEEVLSYYKRKGFNFSEDYKGTTAMIMDKFTG